MADRAKSISPPYAALSGLLNFINKLRETGIPGRIDPSVFGNASGSLSYSIISTLKYLKLVDDGGIPSQDFIALVKASDEDRVPMWQRIVKSGYPSLFKAGVDLTTMTAGQFDEHVRNEFGASGSTVDKIALFFIGAAKLAGVPLSAHLLARKSVATSSAAKKSAKQRKRENGEAADDEGENDPLPPAAQPKALEYQLIDLMSQPDIDDEVKQSIWSLVQYLTARKAKKEAASA
jgi:Family of unknown function (DUF5343)